MLEPEDLIHDEIEHPEQTAWLQNSYTLSQDDQCSLLRIRTRLLEQRAAQSATAPDRDEHANAELDETLKQPAVGQFLSSPVTQRARRKRKPVNYWRLVALVAVLCVAILSATVYALVLPTIQAGHHVTPTITPTTVPYQNPPVYDVKMTSLTTGWGRGGSVQDNYVHIVRTTDGGKTWRAFDFTDQPKGLLSYFFLDDQVAWVIPGSSQDPHTNETLLHTIDGGQHWTTSDLPPLIKVLTFIDRQYGWAWSINVQTTDVLYKTMDGGKTWTKLGTTSANRAIDDLSPGPLPFNNGFNLTFITPQQGWATVYPSQEYAHALLYMTQDGGQTWRLQQLAQPTTGPISGIHTTIFGSSTSGAYAVLLPPNFFTPQHALMRVISQVNSKSPREFYIYETNDGGRSWQPLGTHIEVLSESSVYVGLIDTTHIVLTNVNIVTVYALINGQWQKQHSVQIAERVGSIPFFIDSQHGWLTASQRSGDKITYTLYATSDGGASWHEVMHVTTDAPQGGG